MKRILLLCTTLLWHISTSAQTIDVLTYGDGCKDSLYAFSFFSDFNSSDLLIVNYGDNSNNDTVPADIFEVYHTYTEASPLGFDVRLTIIDGSENVIYDSTYLNLAIISDCGGPKVIQPWKMETRQPGLVGVTFNNNIIFTSLSGCANEDVTFEFFPPYNATDNITIEVSGVGSPVSVTVAGNAPSATLKVGDAGTYNVSAVVRDNQNNIIKSLSEQAILPVTTCATAVIDILSFKATQFDTACAYLPFQMELVGTIFSNQYIAIHYGDGTSDTVPESNRLITHTYEIDDTFDLFIQVLNNDFSLDTEDTIYNAIATFDCGIDLGCTAAIAPGGDICLTGNTFTLNPTIDKYTNFEWTTTGNGQLGSSTSSNTSYTVDAQDKLVTFELTATRSGCRDTTLSVTYNISRPITIASIADIEVCGSGNIALSYPGGVMPVGAKWFGSKGTISNPTSPTATYTSSLNTELIGADKVLIGDPENNCPNSVDTISIVALRSPQVQLGENTTNLNPSFNITGTINGTHTSGVWTTSGTGTFGNANTISTTYTPSNSDKLAGSITLTLTSTNDKGCANHNSSYDVLVSPCDVSISNKTKLEGNVISLDAVFQNPSLSSQGEVAWIVDPELTSFGNNIAEKLSIGLVFGFYRDISVTKPQASYAFKNTGTKKIYMLYSTSDLSCQSIDSIVVDVTSITQPIQDITIDLLYNDKPVTKGSVTFLNFNVLNYAFTNGLSQNRPLIAYAFGLNELDKGRKTFSLPQDSYVIITSGEVIGSPLKETTFKGYLTNGFYEIDVFKEIGKRKEGTSLARMQNIVIGEDKIVGTTTLTNDTLNPKSNLSAQKIENAYISLWNENDSLVMATTSNLYGDYELRNISKGIYKLKASYLGEEYNISDIETDYFIVDGDSNVVDEYDFRFIVRGLPEIVLSTNDLEIPSKQEAMAIYPNPTKGTFSITLPEKIGTYQLSIVDMSGFTTYSEQGKTTENMVKVDTKTFKPGLYLVSIKSTGGMYHGKLTIN